MRAELVRAFEAKGSAGFLSFVKDEIFRLSQPSEGEAEKRLFFVLLNALSFASRYGQLSRDEVDQINALAVGILQKNNVNPETSKLSYLYSELYMLRSQIAFREGSVWTSVWRQQLSMRLALPSDLPSLAYHYLTMGNRCLRLGHSQAALVYYQKSLEHESTREHQDVALIGKVRALRYLMRQEESRALIQEALASKDMSPDLALDLQWEQDCMDLAHNQDFTRLERETRKGGSYDRPSFRLEAACWAYALSEVTWQKKLPKIKSIFRNEAGESKRDPSFFKISLGLEQAYDTEVPFFLRLSQIESLIEQIASVLKGDKQLLCWLVLTRWLLRNKNPSLAHLTMTEYQTLSLRLSDGRTRDVLGIASDIDVASILSLPHLL